MTAQEPHTRYAYAGACEECGGDMVLDEEAFDEIIQGHSQFGTGA